MRWAGIIVAGIALLLDEIFKIPTELFWAIAGGGIGIFLAAELRAIVTDGIKDAENSIKQAVLDALEDHDMKKEMGE